MGWIAFEILINGFQAFLLLFYVKRCFAYAKPHPVADALVFTAVVAMLSLFVFVKLPAALECLYIVPPVLYVVFLSSEPRASSLYWMAVLNVMFCLISVASFPLYELLKRALHIRFSHQWLDDAIWMIATNAVLFLSVKRIIQIKRTCPLCTVANCAAFILTLISIWIVEEILLVFYHSFGEAFVVQFAVAYLALIASVVWSMSLFASDSAREYRHQAELAMLNQSRKHQQELTQMYEELIERRHDYKHHLQTLEELVSGSDLAAKDYIDTMVRESAVDALILTGSHAVDALLAAKLRSMRSQGIEFQCASYPLKDLPVSTTDFCSIVGNLLDNAIEGVQRARAIQSKHIRLAFSRSWDMFYIYCENPCDPAAVTQRNGRFASSKRDKASGMHGIGISSIEAIAGRAEGRAEFSVQNGVFKAKVVLPYLKDGKL